MPIFSHENISFTPEGGLAVRLINKTGANSVKGTLVKPSLTTDYAFELTAADDEEIVGAVYENGIADGSTCLVVISGIVDVLLENTTSGTRGYFVRTSITVAGRADATTASPPGGGIVQHDIHFREIGHCLQSIAGGTDVLCRILMHFN